MSNLRFRPYKRSKVYLWFHKAGAHHHSSPSMLSNAFAGAGASKSLETCLKSTRTYYVAFFQEKAKGFPCWGDLKADFLSWQVRNFQLICYSQRVTATSQYNDSGSARCSKWPNDWMVAMMKHCWLPVQGGRGCKEI